LNFLFQQERTDLVLLPGSMLEPNALYEVSPASSQAVPRGASDVYHQNKSEWSGDFIRTSVHHEYDFL
jgi:hypothetical protein